jgi:hypothetical protein
VYRGVPFRPWGSCGGPPGGGLVGFCGAPGAGPVVPVAGFAAALERGFPGRKRGWWLGLVDDEGLLAADVIGVNTRGRCSARST